jgi:hypothetical protein
LHEFYESYPTIFKALRATFALLPSASRIVEQIHGMVRENYNPQTPYDFLDNMMKYIVKFSYNMREERRRYVRKMKAKRAKAEGQPKSRVSAKHSDRKRHG